MYSCLIHWFGWDTALLIQRGKWWKDINDIELEGFCCVPWSGLRLGAERFHGSGCCEQPARASPRQNP